MAEYAWENGMAERLNGVSRTLPSNRKCKSFTELPKKLTDQYYFITMRNLIKCYKEVTYAIEKLITFGTTNPAKMTKSLDANLKGWDISPIPLMTKPHKRIRMYFRKYSVLSGKTGQRYLGIVNFTL